MSNSKILNFLSKNKCLEPISSATPATTRSKDKTGATPEKGGRDSVQKDISRFWPPNIIFPLRMKKTVIRKNPLAIRVEHAGNFL